MSTPLEDNLRALADTIERLRARCEHLYRENTLLQKENHQLRGKCDKAKQRLNELIANLPDYE